MTRDEVRKLLGTAMIAYPKWLADKDKHELSAVAEVWFRMLGDIDYQLADAALAKHVATSPFPPSIAELRSAALSLLPGDGLPDGDEAWGEVVYHLQHTGYMRTPEWSHPAIGRTVEAMWGSWANACATVMTDSLNVDRAQFVRMYETMCKRHREDALLPAPVKEIAAQLADKLRVKPRALPGGGDG